MGIDKMSKIFDFTVKNIDGEVIELAQYKGKVLLIVNVASKCGFTRQYTDLQALYRKHKDKGFEILAFPCNQFGGQEPWEDSEIKNFCHTKYKISFPLFSKVLVNGSGTEPLYAFLKLMARGMLWSKRIKWNFTKFLVDKNGVVVDRYAPYVNPIKLEDKIIELIVR